MGGGFLRVLGPLELECDGASVPLGPARQQAVLAVLALEAGRPVRPDVLLDAVWGEVPPGSGAAMVHTYVHRLRKVCGDALTMRRTGSGYLLDPGSFELDLELFDADVRAAVAALDPGRAADHYAAALGRWRSAPLEGLPGHYLEVRREELHARHRAAGIGWAENVLALGRNPEVLDWAGGVLARDPLHERLHELQVLALYRSGRVAEALAAYETARSVLSAELGVEPGPGLRDLHRRMLQRDPELDLVPAAASVTLRPVPAQLPAGPGQFVGRDAELARLDELTRDALVCVLSGPGGVGKTALVTRWARQAAERYPDGQLYVNLNGFSDSAPLEPGEALAGFLRALGTDAAAVPADLDERAAQFRSAVAGRRVLVVLDNARSAEQVRPLLPAEPGCSVVITSRDRLAGLTALHGASSLGLATLGPDASRELLVRMVGADAVAAEPAAYDELARRCGGLPLALRIAITNVLATGTSAARIAAELRDAPLPTLQVPGDPASALRRAFDVSYAALDEVPRMLLRRAGLAPDPEFSDVALAALAGLPPAEVRSCLRTLVTVHLIDPVRTPAGAQRYRLHDLLRAYAQDLARTEDAPAERAAASGRLAEWYLHATSAAVVEAVDDFPRPPGDVVPPVVLPFEGYRQALEWLDVEFGSLLALARGRLAGSTPALSWRLVNALWFYAGAHRPVADLVTLTAAGTSAAADDPGPAADWLAGYLAAAGAVRAGARSDGLALGTAAVTSAVRADWPHAEAISLRMVARMHGVDGDLDAAQQAYAAADAARSRVPDLRWTDRALIADGVRLLDAGELVEAEQRFRALIAGPGGRTAPPQLQAIPWVNLGELLWLRGDFTGSAGILEQAEALVARFRNQSVEVATLLVLGRTLASQGRSADAVECLDAADDIRRTGHHDPFNDLECRIVGATILQLVDEPDRALELWESVLATDGGEAVSADVVRARIGAGRVHLHAGRVDAAAEAAGAALWTARNSHVELYAAQALDLAAAVHLERGRVAQALDRAAEGLATHRRTGHRPGEARSLEILADALHRDGRAAEAARHRQAADELYGSFGDGACRAALRRLHGAPSD